MDELSKEMLLILPLILLGNMWCRCRLLACLQLFFEKKLFYFHFIFYFFLYATLVMLNMQLKLNFDRKMLKHTFFNYYLIWSHTCVSGVNELHCFLSTFAKYMYTICIWNNRYVMVIIIIFLMHAWWMEIRKFGGSEICLDFNELMFTNICRRQVFHDREFPCFSPIFSQVLMYFELVMVW